MSLLWRQNHHFGVAPLLEDWNDPEDDYALIEHVRMRGTLDTDSDGSVLATGSYHDRTRPMYNSGWGHDSAQKQSYYEWVDAKRIAKNKARRELIEHWRGLKARQEREKLVQNQISEAWAVGIDFTSTWQDAYQEHQAEEEERLEKQKAWALHTSHVERRITEIADCMDVNGRDRATIRAMLRYQNLGVGLGQRWDIQAFARHITDTRRDDLFLQTLSDIERLYRMLINHYEVETA